LWRTPFNKAGTLFPTLSVALIVVCCVLLIACANVGNLLLVKAFGQRHEMAVRLAIGAGRGRLLKQMLTEAFMLSTIAAAADSCSRRGAATCCRSYFPHEPA
jgi:ABC-type antimicrobial peptide transport system permease subunit